MTTQTNSNMGTLENALYALVVAKPVPDATTLDNLVRQYPEHAAALTNMAVELVLEAMADRLDEPVLPEISGRSEAVASAMSRFHNRLYQVKIAEKAAKAKAAAPVNLFSSLSRAELREFGASMGANTVFVIKLRDRLIDSGTMTKGFQQHVANKAHVSLDFVVAHFARPAEIPIATHYKADEKPTIEKKQTFEEAVRGPGLTPEQQSFLLGFED
jgi:hypothetical protein